VLPSGLTDLRTCRGLHCSSDKSRPGAPAATLRPAVHRDSLLDRKFRSETTEDALGKPKDADAEAPLHRGSLVLFSMTDAELLAMGPFTLEGEVLDANEHVQILTFSFTHDTTRELACPTHS